jgi:hypothetical protein
MKVFVVVHICVAVGDPIIKRRGLVPYIGVCPISQRHNVEVFSMLKLSTPNMHKINTNSSVTPTQKQLESKIHLAIKYDKEHHS